MYGSEAEKVERQWIQSYQDHQDEIALKHLLDVYKPVIDTVISDTHMMVVTDGNVKYIQKVAENTFKSTLLEVDADVNDDNSFIMKVIMNKFFKSMLVRRRAILLAKKRCLLKKY
jgi:hypothetical protein